MQLTLLSLVVQTLPLYDLLNKSPVSLFLSLPLTGMEKDH